MRNLYRYIVGIKTTLRILNAPDYKGPDGGEMRVTTVRNADIKEWSKHYQQQPKELQERTFMTDPEVGLYKLNSVYPLKAPGFNP
jgi:hypothetical protein